MSTRPKFKLTNLPLDKYAATNISKARNQNSMVENGEKLRHTFINLLFHQFYNIAPFIGYIILDHIGSGQQLAYHWRRMHAVNSRRTNGHIFSIKDEIVYAIFAVSTLPIIKKILFDKELKTPLEAHAVIHELWDSFKLTLGKQFDHTKMTNINGVLAYVYEETLKLRSQYAIKLQKIEKEYTKEALLEKYTKYIENLSNEIDLIIHDEGVKEKGYNAPSNVVKLLSSHSSIASTNRNKNPIKKGVLKRVQGTNDSAKQGRRVQFTSNTRDLNHKFNSSKLSPIKYVQVKDSKFGLKVKVPNSRTANEDSTKKKFLDLLFTDFEALTQYTGYIVLDPKGSGNDLKAFWLAQHNMNSRRTNGKMISIKDEIEYAIFAVSTLPIIKKIIFDKHIMVSLNPHDVIHDMWENYKLALSHEHNYESISNINDVLRYVYAKAMQIHKQNDAFLQKLSDKVGKDKLRHKYTKYITKLSNEIKRIINFDDIIDVDTYQPPKHNS